MSRHVLILSSLMLLGAASAPVITEPVATIPEIVAVDSVIPEALPTPDIATVPSVAPISPDETNQALIPALLPPEPTPSIEWDCPACGMG